MIRIVTRRRLAAQEAQQEREQAARVAAASRSAELAVELSAAWNRGAGLQKRVEKLDGDLGAAELHIEQVESREAALQEELQALRFDSGTDLRAASAEIARLQREITTERRARRATEVELERASCALNARGDIDVTVGSEAAPAVLTWRGAWQVHASQDHLWLTEERARTVLVERYGLDAADVALLMERARRFPLVPVTEPVPLAFTTDTASEEN